MAKLVITTGYCKNGLPYFRFGSGQRKLVIFSPGPDFSRKPPSGMFLQTMSNMFKRLAGDFTVYYVSRKPDLPTGYSMRDMSEDYATMIKDEFEGPVDILGFSDGGPCAQYFAVDHPDLVHRLVLAETGYAMSEVGKEFNRQMGKLARQGKWRTAASVIAAAMYPHGTKKIIFKSLMWLLGKRVFGTPADISAGLVELEAENKHDFKERLSEIKVPTLVIGGEDEQYYPIRETAAGIPNAKVVLYKGLGHEAILKPQFMEDVLAFLIEDTA
jgi:pimeloyl-ACP methyl ester carboxylesterase